MIPKLGFLTELAKKFDIHQLNSPNLFLRIVAVIFLSILMTLDFLPLLNEYKDNNVATQIAIIKSGSARPPNMTICLPYYSGTLSNIAKYLASNRSESGDCIECDAMPNHAWDVWNTMDIKVSDSSDNQMYEGALATTLFKKISANGDNFSVLKLNQSNFNWNQPLVDAAWMLLAASAPKAMIS